MQKKEEIKSILDEKPEYRHLLFIKGYLITDQNINSLSKYPFYNNWKQNELGYINNKKLYIYSSIRRLL